MNLLPYRRRNARLLGMALVLAGLVSTVAAALPAEAATIPSPVSSITVTPTNPRLSDSVRTDVVWCVPDSATAGDTFDIALPPELIQLPRSFNLRDPNGVLVAVATITNSPSVATFTFNDYVDTHTNVCGTAFFESRLSGSLVPGQTYTLTYVVNGTTTFQPVITISQGTTVTGRGSARKGAYFNDPTDECRTVAQGCLGWYIESQLGPLQSVTITDDGLVGAAFECSTLTVRLWSVDANGVLLQSFSPASGGTTVSTTCSPTGFQVVATNVPAARLVRVLIRSTPQVLDPNGGVLYTNSATVTHVFPNGTTDEDSTVGQRRSALAGGDANGVQPPPPTTTEAPSTTTTLAASLAPVPPALPQPVVPQPISPPVNAQLPATGSHSTLLFAGMFLFFGGALLVVATRRRDLSSDVR